MNAQGNRILFIYAMLRKFINVKKLKRSKKSKKKYITIVTSSPETVMSGRLKWDNAAIEHKAEASIVFPS